MVPTVIVLLDLRVESSVKMAQFVPSPLYGVMIEACYIAAASMTERILESTLNQ